MVVVRERDAGDWGDAEVAAAACSTDATMGEARDDEDVVVGGGGARDDGGWRRISGDDGADRDRAMAVDVTVDVSSSSYGSLGVKKSRTRDEDALA